MPSINLFHTDFKNQYDCLDSIYKLRYPNIICPKCKSNRGFKIVKGRTAYHCPGCGFQVHPLAGTIMEKTTTVLGDWFYAIHLQSQSKNGVSSRELERRMDVCYKTALRISHRIKSLLKSKCMGKILVSAPIEIDVTQVNKTWFTLKKKKDRTPKSQYVIAFYQRFKESDNCRIKKLPDNQPETIEMFVRQTITAPATIYCEQGILPLSLKKDYTIEELNAIAGEHVRGDIHINNVKNVWKDLKRNIKREYIHVSNEHLQSYCDEVSWYINNRNLSHKERFEKMISNAANNGHLTYDELTSQNRKKKSA